MAKRTSWAETHAGGPDGATRSAAGDWPVTSWIQVESALYHQDELVARALQLEKARVPAIEADSECECSRTSLAGVLSHRRCRPPPQTTRHQTPESTFGQHGIVGSDQSALNVALRHGYAQGSAGDRGVAALTPTFKLPGLPGGLLQEAVNAFHALRQANEDYDWLEPETWCAGNSPEGVGN